MKQLYTLLFAMAITLAANSQVLDGSDCSHAKEIPTIPDSCTVNEHQLNAGDYEQWHHVKPAQPEIHFKIEPSQTQPEAHIHKVYLKKGSCGGMQAIEEKDISLGQTLEITRTDLTVNDDYYIKTERDPSCAQCTAQGGAFYGLCVQTSSSGPNIFNQLILLEGCGLNYKQQTMRLNQRFTTNTAKGDAMPKTVNFTGIPANANLLKAYLWFTAISANETIAVPNCKLTQQGYSTYYFNADALIIDSHQPYGICWGSSYQYTGSYFKDVTLYINQTSLNASFELDIPINSNFDVNGATLMFVYSNCTDPSTIPAKLTLWHGLDNHHAFDESYNHNGNFSYQANMNAKAFFIIADMENSQSQYSINGSANTFIPGNMYNFLEKNTTLTSNQSNINYSVITDGSDCYAVSVFGVYTQNPAYVCSTLTANISTSILSGCAKNVSVITTGGIPPYTYLWNIGATAQNIDVTTTGNYSVTVTDASGCNVIADDFIIISSPFTADAGPDQFFCNSGNASVSITGGTSPYSFLWSNGATNQTITGLTSGTYGVTVTDGNGCYDDDNIIITVSDLSAIAYQYASNCGTGSAIVSVSGGTSPYSYTWSNGSNGTNLMSVPDGNYAVTVTDANGCNDIAIVTIVGNPVPNAPQFTGLNNNCESNSMATYNVIGYNSNYSYYWTVDYGTPNPVFGSSATINWSAIPSTGTGTITLTVSNPFGCDASTTLIIYPCCRPTGGIAGGTPRIDISNDVSSNFTSPMVNQYVAINGTFTIDNNFTFQNCDVSMGPDAKIEISPNKSLTCTTTATATIPTKLYAGCNIMWDGIYLFFPSSLTITSADKNKPTTLMDAKNAVVTKSSNSYSITKTVFNNNLKGIIQQNTATSATVTGNDFKSADGALKPYYTGTTLNNAARAISFIEITDVGGINIGAAGATNLNLFDNADNGIFCIRSTVNIVNNKFQNFKQPSPQFNAGNAIFAVQNVSITVGGSAALKNNFIDCDAGVRGLFEQSMTVKDNKFLRVENGVFQSGLFSTGANKTVSILANELINYRYGITVEQMPRCTLSINNNVLKQTNSSWKDGAGITVDHKLILSKTFVPQEIVGNTLTGGFGSYTDIKGTLLNGGPY